MSANTFLLLCSVIAFSLVSCYSKVSQRVQTDFDRFPIEKKIEEVKLLNLDQLNTDYLDLGSDSILFIGSGEGYRGYHFALYNLAKKSFLHPQLAAGRKEGQSLSFLSYGIEQNFIWSFDINKEKIVMSGFDSVGETSNHFVKEIAVPEFYYSVQLLNDTMLLASGNYEANDNFQISMVNLKNGEIVKQMAPYSSDSTLPFTRPKKMAYESFLFVKPSKNKCVLACRYADKIEIVELLSGKSKTIHGPVGFRPEMLVVTGSNSKQISVRGPNTKFAFIQGDVTDNFIYLLYSGNKEGTSHQFYGKYIYIYDWKGQPVQRLELENDTKAFAVTSDDSRVYTYDPKSKYINTAQIKN